MKLAYLIQCHKNPQQIKLFVDSLELSSDDNVVIHVDAKSQHVRSELSAVFKSRPNIHFIENSISVNWSGRSQLLATLSMVEFLQTNKIKYDYCLLLSGEDIIFNIPLLKDYLEKNNGMSFVEFRNDREQYLWRVNGFNILRDNRYSQRKIIRIVSSLFIRIQRFLKFKRNNFVDNDIFLGSQWFTISSRHMDIFLGKFSKHFLNKFLFTSCSDEHFFQIMFKKYIKSNEYEMNNMRYIRFSVGSSSPDYLSIDELNELSNSGKYYIARKVSFDVLSQYLMSNK